MMEGGEGKGQAVGALYVKVVLGRLPHSLRKFLSSVCCK